ncbi:MAG: metal ABC transporter ATP-binding protein [Salinarimonadaceae bacterium]|nr:MAG: metal ABC transporter ATP-binding protein [Salinarimonadaceae bacterium]
MTATATAREGVFASDPDSRPGPLVVSGLTVSYGRAPALIGVDLAIAPGSMTAIVGPNGAGKSTLLKAVIGVAPVVAGDIRVFGETLARVRDRVAYVPQRASVDWDFPARVIDVVTMGLYRELGPFGFVRRRHREAAMAHLDRVGMADFAQRQIGQLSGGQQQRVFLARALAQKADLYLLDEPLAGVDAATERAVVAVLHGLRAEGACIVAVHHDLATLRDYFDHVALINRRLVAQGPTAETLTAENLQRTYGGLLAGTQIGRIEIAYAARER